MADRKHVSFMHSYPNYIPLSAGHRAVLMERSRMAHQLVKDLQQDLSRTLDGLRQMAPLANADPASIRNLVFSGLPVLDLSPLRECRFSRPWWGALFPPLATWAARQALQKQLGPAIREHVELYDRQLRAWVKDCIAHLGELYEFEAEVFREQVRRFTAEVGDAGTAQDARELMADIQELQQNQLAEPERATVDSKQ